jgi:hypothetical protein
MKLALLLLLPLCGCQWATSNDGPATIVCRTIVRIVEAPELARKRNKDHAYSDFKPEQE